MLLPIDKQREISKSSNWPCALGRVLAIFLLVTSGAYSLAQIPTPAASPPPKAEPAAPVDPLGRGTPRGAVMGFLLYEGRQDFATAARYLQPTSGRDTDLVQRAKELKALHSKFQSNIGLLSDNPNGTVEPGLPPGEVRAGVFAIGDTTVDVILVRVDDPSAGKIWLISKGTVAAIPQLYAQLESETPTPLERVLPASLFSRYLLGASLAHWVGWLLSIPIAWLLVWLLTLLLSAPRRVWYKLRKRSFRTIWETPLGKPIRCIIAILLHGFFVYLLQPPLFLRAHYFRFLAVLLMGCFAWLASRIADRGFDQAVNRTRAQHHGGESILIVVQRLTHVVMLIIAFVAALALFGLNVTTTLAGLGIGGLAIALAAQKTLENLIGGVSLLMDRAVHVGDFCEIGGRQGTVEDIGLRSLKLRTLNQNLLVVPNGSLSQMQFENMQARPKLLIDTTFTLRIETKVEQLRLVLDRVQRMVNEHPSIKSGTSRVRLNNFSGAAFELELVAYANTGDWGQFTAIRQELILKLADIVEAAGAQFAGPTQLTYLAADSSDRLSKRDDPIAG